jgi:magnesium chelatase family protein
MDRIDLVVQVDRPDPATLLGHSDRETSQRLRERVSDARDRASGRAQGPTARLSGAGLLSACRLSAPSRRVLEIAARRHHLSGRGITRLLRVARTIADLEGAEHVEEGHLTEALSYRAMDRP